MPRPDVRTATPADETAAIGTIMLAFSADPMARWCWPHPHQYVSVMPAFIHAFAGRGFSRNGAFCTDGYVGAALWLPPGVESDDAALDETMARTAAPSVLGDAMKVVEQMQACHPKEPHWYLPVIGVDPAHQGKGHGDALMAYALAQCDREHAPAYLESSNPRNISLYKRHGFEIIKTIQVGASPPVVPMLRKPR